MMTLYLNWQDKETRRWYTVGRLSYQNDEYKFVYTRGAIAAQNTSKFIQFGMMSDLKEVYSSKELFPLFANRILSKSRQDYAEYLQWMDIQEEEANPMLILSRSGGERATDNLQVYPAPEKTNDGRYQAFFFIHGIRHLQKETLKLIDSFDINLPIFPMHDMKNEYDPDAVALRTRDPKCMIGYCPRYLAPDIRTIYASKDNEINIHVRKVNKDAPYQMKILCKIDASWPHDFHSCMNAECEPLAP